MKIFIDTSAFMAIILKEEFFHKQAVTKYKEYKQKRAQMITSDYVLDELFTRCLYRAGSHGAAIAVGLINEVISHNELTVLEVDQQIFKKAEDVFLKFSEHKISFTDATTYVLYNDFALDEVFTLESDFKKMRVNTAFK